MAALIDFNYDFLDDLMNNPKKDFLSGKKLLKGELQSFFAKLDYGFYNIHSYIQKVSYIKEILSSAKILYTEDIVFIKTNKNLTEEDIVVLIRYINICQKNKYMIVLNNRLIYVPFAYRQYEETVIQQYINSILRGYNTRRKNKIIRYKIKKYIKNLITKV